MKKLIAIVTIFGTAALLASPPSNLFVNRDELPSEEEMEEQQRAIVARMKSMYEEAFEKGNEGDDESLTQDEMVEVVFEVTKAQMAAMAGGAGGTIQPPSEEQLDRMKKSLRGRVESQFPIVDTDDDGAVSKAELFKSMFGLEYRPDEEIEDNAKSDRDDDSRRADDSEEQSSEET